MHSDFLKDITENQFVLVLLDEERYIDKLKDIMKSVEKEGSKICYICLSKPYSDVIQDFEHAGINPDDFFFIDVLSSHYGLPRPTENCKFISSPSDLAEIRAAVVDAIERRGCSAIVFDTVSTLLIYQQNSSIVSFTNSLLSEKKQENTKKLFIILKDDRTSEGDLDVLTKDLEMFADKKIDMTADEKDINKGS